VHLKSILIKTQRDATECSLIYFTAKSLYITRVECVYLSNTTLFEGRGIPSIYNIRHNYMFRHLTMVIFRL